MLVMEVPIMFGNYLLDTSHTHYDSDVRACFQCRITGSDELTNGDTRVTGQLLVDVCSFGIRSTTLLSSAKHVVLATICLQCFCFQNTL